MWLYNSIHRFLNKRFAQESWELISVVWDWQEMIHVARTTLFTRTSLPWGLTPWKRRNWRLTKARTKDFDDYLTRLAHRFVITLLNSDQVGDCRWDPRLNLGVLRIGIAGDGYCGATMVMHSSGRMWVIYKKAVSSTAFGRWYSNCARTSWRHTRVKERSVYAFSTASGRSIRTNPW